MNQMYRCLGWVSSVVVLLVAGIQAQPKPEISVSPARVKSGDSLMLTGKGFTPNRTLMSHLIRPDGSEYNPLRFRTDEKGEFAHRIDTSMLDIGTFELWAEDEASKAVSNRIQFTVLSVDTRGTDQIARTHSHSSRTTATGPFR